MIKQIMTASMLAFVLTVGTSSLPATSDGLVGAPTAHAYLDKLKKAAKKYGVVLEKRSVNGTTGPQSNQANANSVIDIRNIIKKRLRRR